MYNNYVEIIGIDEDSKTILAKHSNGSLVLDAIPDAVSYMKSKKDHTMLFRDYFGVVFEITPESTIESAEEAWLLAKQMNNNVRQSKPQTSEQSAPSMQ